MTDTRSNIELVERWLAAFSERWPATEELEGLLAPDFEFVERPNLFSPAGGTRAREQSLAGAVAGQGVLAWQRYTVLAHLADGDEVATRFRWDGELKVDAGALARGTRLTAWCVAHYVVRDGRIARVEQHDCYEAPVPPDAAR